MTFTLAAWFECVSSCILLAYCHFDIGFWKILHSLAGCTRLAEAGRIARGCRGSG
jgi:hypothetical protein